jgi:hypothetical protein
MKIAGGKAGVLGLWGGKILAGLIPHNNFSISISKQHELRSLLKMLGLYL